MRNRDKLIDHIRTNTWVVLLLAAAVSFAFMEADFTLGVIVGGFLVIANFSVLQHTIRAAFSDLNAFQGKKLALVAKSYFRLAFMGVIIYIVITHGWVHPVGLAIGLSVVTFSIIGFGIRSAWKISSREAT